MELEELYQERCEQTTDINEHLPLLRSLAAQVDHVTEFGVREGNSTIAFAVARPQMLISYDINPIPFLLEALLAHTGFRFIRANVLNVQIEPTDLLFIDTYHSCEQLRFELARHADKVRRFIVLHDTEAFGETGEDGNKPGLAGAVKEFVEQGVWQIHSELKNNNGLTVLARRM